MLERLEADTWRTEGESDHGTTTGSGDPITQRKKFLLPSTAKLATTTLKVENGMPTELSYAVDFSADGLLGFKGTALESAQLNRLTLNTGGIEFG